MAASGSNTMSILMILNAHVGHISNTYSLQILCNTPLALTLVYQALQNVGKNKHVFKILPDPNKFLISTWQTHFFLYPSPQPQEIKNYHIKKIT